MNVANGSLHARKCGKRWRTIANNLIKQEGNLRIAEGCHSLQNQTVATTDY